MSLVSDQLRLDLLTGLASPLSRVFFDPKTCKQTDLSGVRLLGCRVDTVRQHYKGRLRPDVLCMIEEGGMVSFAGHTWHAGRVGRDSGYQYKLQNQDLGFVILLKNFNAKVENIGPHLKIEVSPHAIQSCSPDVLQGWLDRFAAEAMDCLELGQCAVHLALDFQGWTPPADLVQTLQCRSRSRRDISGIKEIYHAGNAVSYGQSETFMFGSAGGVQLAIYDKTLQARAVDKLDYWQAEWRKLDNPFDPSCPLNYDDSAPVWRLELRFHHSIIEQFAQGSCTSSTGEIINTRSYAEFAGHLDGLFQYGLTSFRLLSSPTVYHPFWSLMRQDVRVSVPTVSLVEQTEYKRYYKTSKGFSGKNVELFLGNMVSLLARERVGAKKAFASLKEWDCWPVIRDHYAEKGKTERQIYEHIRDLLEERSIRWGRAV